jgi:hypothetical protein
MDNYLDWLESTTPEERLGRGRSEMKITLTFPSDGNDTRHIRAEWLPVGKWAGQEVRRYVGVIQRHHVGGMQTLNWTATLDRTVSPVRIRRETEQEARQAVCDYLDENGRWW